MNDRPAHSPRHPSTPRLYRLRFLPVIDSPTGEAVAFTPASCANGNGHDGDGMYRQAESKIPTQQLPVAPLAPRPRPRPQTWEPGTSGFDEINEDDSTGKQDYESISTLVLESISIKQGQPKPVMHSELSGTAGAAGLVGIGNILGNILKYGSVFLLQYALGPALYGIYTLSVSLINLVAALFNLGLDDAMIRYVAIYQTKRLANSLRGLLIFCTLLAGVAGMIGALMLLFFTPAVVTFWSSSRPTQAANVKNSLTQLIPLLQLMAPMIPLLCMQVIWFAGLRGFKAFKVRILSTSVLQPVVQFLLIGIALFVFRNTLIIGAALALLTSTIFATLLNLYFLIRQFSTVATPEPERYELREWLSFATLNFLTAIIDTVLDSIDTVLLASFGIPRVQLGQYGAAIRINAFISLPLLSLNNVFSPTIAELHSQGEWQKLEAMFKVVTRWAITFSLPIFLIIVLFSPYILGLSGAGYVAAWPLLIAFALGGILNAGTGSVGYMLLMTGHNKLSFLNSLVAVGSNVVLGIILTPRYGAMGTAISTGLAICILNLMRLLQVRLLLKMQPYSRNVLKPLGAGLVSGTGIGIVLYLLSPFRLSVLLGRAILPLQLALIPVFVVSYIWLLWLFKTSPEDEIVLKVLRKKLLRNGKKK